MSVSRKLLRLGGLWLLIGILIPAAGVLAQSSGGFGGRPANPDPSNPRSQSIFIYTLEGGEAKEDQVLVTNNSDSEAKIAIYAVDGVTTNTGSYTCRQASEARTGIGEWLKLSEEVITLKPLEKQLVDFTLTMPENADVGEHNGCIVFENAEDEGESVSGGAVRLRTRSAIRVVSTIPGELHRNIEFASFSAVPTNNGQQSYEMTLQNIGNVSADVDTKITLTDMFGNIVYENGGGYPVFANQKLDINYTNETRPFWGGWFTAKASISYDNRAGTFGTSSESELVTKEAEEVSLFIAPSPVAMMIILIPIILLIGLLVWFVWRKLARRRTTKQWGEYVVVQGDTVENVARAHKVGWQKLASINNIKAPYSLSGGQRLKVPMVGGGRVEPQVAPVDPAVKSAEKSEPIATRKSVKSIEIDSIDDLIPIKAKRTPRTKKK